MTKMKYTIAKNVEELDSQIRSAGEHYSKARRTAQNAAVNVIIHAAKHGDYTRATALVELVGDSTAMVKWFEEFGGLVVDEENGGFCNWKGADYIKDKLELAKATMFWSFKAPNPWKGYDLHETIAKTIDRAEKALEKKAKLEAEGEHIPDDLVNVNVTELNALKAVYASNSTQIN